MTSSSIVGAVLSTTGTDSEGQPGEVPARPDPSIERPLWDSIPPVAMQQLWFALQRLEWTTLVVLPADPDGSAADFGRPLYQVARLVLGPRIRLVDARGIKLTRTASLILDMAQALAAADPPRTLVLLDSVISHPPGVPIALAADAALLGVELGKTRLDAVAETLQFVDREKFIGVITLPPAKRKSG